MAIKNEQKKFLHTLHMEVGSNFVYTNVLWHISNSVLLQNPQKREREREEKKHEPPSKMGFRIEFCGPSDRHQDDVPFFQSFEELVTASQYR